MMYMYPKGKWAQRSIRSMDIYSKSVIRKDTIPWHWARQPSDRLDSRISFHDPSIRHSLLCPYVAWIVTIGAGE